MTPLYLSPFIASFIVSLFLTWVLIGFSEKFKLFFAIKPRHIHKKNISRLGGIAIIASFIATIIFNPDLVLTQQLIGFLTGAIIILFFGVMDDFRALGWKKQLFFQLAVSVVIILSNIRVDYLTNPFGGMIRLDNWEIFSTPVFGSMFIIFWIVFLMNVLNWVDGIDGLAGGVGVTGAGILFFLSVSALVNQPPLGIISVALVGAVLGFLVFNFHPAKIFMGTSGAMFIGFSLAVISIFSGVKLATLVLVLAVPILDALWVILQRIKKGGSIFSGDRSHLHYRLLELGFSQRQIVVFYYILSAFFGIIALNISGLGKVAAFLIFTAIILGILMAVSLISKTREAQSQKE
ncbi:undecaprenyl/decaprenyl-phosphate alpha-N-acetylglucosaminyl 1-phosphate transferase [Patescibacteria group bacterium]|nr:undecaprenyl/decaprenyl-phosphate alpha-N-acetylglucosaminyl 1-phosphate transferase [Patescibacteria group bacterium]